MSTEKPDNETGQETTTSVASKIAALETCQPSHAPPNTPRKTSTRKSQSIMRKFTLVADALSGQIRIYQQLYQSQITTQEYFVIYHHHLHVHQNM